MKAHGESSISKRTEAQDDIRQEIQGKPPTGPYEFAEDLTFDSVRPSAAKPKTIAEATRQRFQQAVYRDARYGSAGGVYLRGFGLSQALQEVYNGSKQLVDGGVRDGAGGLA
jgi:hypothetical protein